MVSFFFFFLCLNCFHCWCRTRRLQRVFYFENLLYSLHLSCVWLPILLNLLCVDWRIVRQFLKWRRYATDGNVGTDYNGSDQLHHTHCRQKADSMHLVEIRGYCSFAHVGQFRAMKNQIESKNPNWAPSLVWCSLYTKCNVRLSCGNNISWTCLFTEFVIDFMRKTANHTESYFTATWEHRLKVWKEKQMLWQHFLQ